MSKPLSEMTLEELWQLFPIFLTGHQACWADWYEEEAALLRSLLGPGPLLSHIGSTAIKGIWAKPILDILIEADDPALAGAADTLRKAGYIRMADSGNRVDFNKGYTPEGFAQRVFHLHLRRMGDNDELYFRDYMNAHPEAAKEYEALKLGLWKRYEHDRDGYTGQKTAFVAKYTARAKEAYPGRYARPEALVRDRFPAGTGEGVLRLLSALRKEGMALERGLVYVGVSAGSIISAENLPGHLGYLPRKLEAHREIGSPGGSAAGGGGLSYQRPGGENFGRGERDYRIGGGSMEMIQREPTDADVLALFSEHDDFMLDFLGEDSVFYTRYSAAENIEAVWAAYENGLPVGCIAYRTKEAGTGEVKRLFIRPAYRGRGLSKELLNTLERYAKKQGCRRLYLDTRITLEPAVSLYRGLGFQITFQQGLYIQMEKEL